MNISKILSAGLLMLVVHSPVLAINEAVEITRLTNDSNATDTLPVKLNGACTINVTRFSDGRFSKESIGTEFAIPSSAVEPWIEGGLNRLKEYGFVVQQNPVPVSNAINLDVRLIRAYTWLGNMRINGMVAFDINRGNMEQGGQKFRATGSKTNMMNAKTEHVTALNYALNHTIHKLALSLQTQCLQGKSALN